MYENLKAKRNGSQAKRKLSEKAGRIPVGLSIVLYLVSYVRNTLVILTPAFFQALAPPNPDLYNQVPVEYHDFLDVFSEPHANVLPPHRKYDLEINLKPGAVPPWVASTPCLP